MGNSFLNLIINFLLMAFAIFSVLELIYNKSNPGFFLKKVTKTGWYLILIAMGSIIFNFHKDRISDRKQVESDSAKAKVDLLLLASQEKISQLQLSTKEIIIKTIESTYANSIKSSNEALAKYNLKITDSLNSVVRRLKLDAVNPQLLIAPSEKGKQVAYLTKDNGNNTLNIQLISKNGTCYNILIYYYIIKGPLDSMGTPEGFAEFIKNSTLLKRGVLGVGTAFLTEDVISTRGIGLSQDILDNSEVLVFLTGSFSKDPLGKIRVPYDESFEFNLKENKFITKTEFKYESLKKKLMIL